MCGKRVPEIMSTFSFPHGAAWPIVYAVDMACDVVAHMEAREPQLASALWGDRKGCFETPSASALPEVRYVNKLLVPF